MHVLLTQCFPRTNRKGGEYDPIKEFNIFPCPQQWKLGLERRGGSLEETLYELTIIHQSLHLVSSPWLRVGNYQVCLAIMWFASSGRYFPGFYHTAQKKKKKVLRSWADVSIHLPPD